jgi:hypothetical protein
MDGGKVSLKSDQICPPKLLIFDLSTDKLVKRLIIPLNISSNKDGIGALLTVLVFAADCRNIINTMIVSVSF